MQKNSSLPFLLILLLGLGGYLGYVVYNHKIPCVTPISYDLAAYDKRFELPRSEIEEAIRDAAGVWNEALQKEIFVESEEPELPVFFVYQGLQQIIDSIEEINSDIDAAQAELKVVANQYAALKREFELAQRRGRATQEMADELNALFKRYYELRDAINASVAEGRELPQGERQAGRFVLDEDGTRVYVYGFADKTEMMSILIHEFGHALGLGHVSDPEAVMYPSDENMSTTLNESDLAELALACEQKGLFSGILSVLKDRFPNWIAV